MSKALPRLLTPKKEYTVDYPAAIEFENQQRDIFWSPDEIVVEKDLHDIRTKCTEAEIHGVTTVLKLFTLYELQAGHEYWGGRIVETFKRPADIQRMAACFSFFETNVHAPFYDKLNKVMGLDTDEFYSDYVKDDTLRGRMEWIDEVINDPDILKSLAVFSMVEGVILYSSFAFLKHFQAEGKNKLTNVTAGINFSVKDENLHSQGGAWLFRQLLSESNLSEEEYSSLKEKIYEAAGQMLSHEERIIEMVFERGRIEGITAHQLKLFVQSRIDLCLQQLGLEPAYRPTYNPIAKWFYKNIGGGQFHDFFQKVGSEYNRDWVESRFVW